MTDLNNLIIQEGTELDESKMKITSTDEILKTSKTIEKQLAYEDDNIMTAPTKFPTADSVAMSKEEAEKHAIYEVAKNKLEKENAAYKKLSDDEKIKDYITKSEFYRATNDFYHKYGYEMNGQQKRIVKRNIETAWKKGKYKLTDDQRTDILVQLANAAEYQPSQGPIASKKQNQVEQLSSLTSLTYKG